MKSFLRTHKTDIVDITGKKVTLKGVNLGGWLLMEAYFMHSPNRPEKVFKKEFASKLGAPALKEFEKMFRDSFIAEADVKDVSRKGFNCIRVPFHYKVVESSPYQHRSRGLKYLDNVIKWAEKYKLWVILDLHAAPGCQNHDWHGDSDGKAELWNKRSFQQRTIKLWQFLASRYKDEACVAGYDVVNESVISNSKKLNALYRDLINAIRKVDKNHIIFLEGNLWSTDIECLDEFVDDNYALSIHFYEPIDFTFNFVPQLKFPRDFQKGAWTKKHIRTHLKRYSQVAKQRAVPILVGEFGVNSRNGFYGEDTWLEFVLSCFKACNFHWTYWTYKAIKNSFFPDGIYSYYDNPPWVNRMGPKTGWETYSTCWKKSKNEMIESWNTKHFKGNNVVLKVLRKYARANK